MLKKYRKRAQTLKTFEYYYFRTFPGAKSYFVPKGIPMGFEMAEKKLNKQTNKQTNR